ncbi:hypothetical protein BH11PAT1_BH11PAT1_3040 [soil metagenome]
MNDTVKIFIKHGTQLSPKELEEINSAKAREWQIPPMQKSEQESALFFLLKNEQDAILAQGEIIEINDIVFHNESFSILGIGGVVANEKGKGYGREIMTVIKNYIIKHKKTGVGFTRKVEFYEKCGFSIDTESKKRFVYMKDGKRMTHETDECIVFLDGKDTFMEKIAAYPDQDVILPISPQW